jgi:hypothetical protein
LLRALFGLPLQIFDLAAHVTKLPFLFCIFQAVIVRETLLRLRDEPGAFFVDLPGDRQLQLLLLAFELSLPLAHREFEASSLFEIFRLILHLVLQPSEFLRDPLFRLLRGICLRALQVLLQPALVFRAQLALLLLQRFVELLLERRLDIGA